MRGKYHRAIIEVKMHGRVVYEGGLVQVDVEAVIALHLQRSLYSGR